MNPVSGKRRKRPLCTACAERLVRESGKASRGFEEPSEIYEDMDHLASYQPDDSLDWDSLNLADMMDD